MSDTITLPAQPPQTETVADLPVNPADIMMNVIVAFLTPMFLTCSAGNISFARLAAIETISAYRGKTHADLFSIGQIIGFGLAALGSLSLSMADNLSPTMMLRFRANAVALNRGAEQNRRALHKSLAAETPQPDPVLNEDAASRPGQPAPRADVTQTPARSVAAPAAAAASGTQPASVPAKPASAAAPAPMVIPTAAQLDQAQDNQTQHDQAAPQPGSERLSQLAWADVMTDEAALLMANIADLPPQEREAAARQAAALTRTATTLRAEANGAIPENPPVSMMSGQDTPPISP